MRSLLLVRKAWLRIGNRGTVTLRSTASFSLKNYASIDCPRHSLASIWNDQGHGHQRWYAAPSTISNVAAETKDPSAFEKKLIYEAKFKPPKVRNVVPLTVIPTILTTFNSLSLMFNPLVDNFATEYLLAHGATLVCYGAMTASIYSVRRYITRIHAFISPKTNQVFGFLFQPCNFLGFQTKPFVLWMDDIEPNSSKSENDYWSVHKRGSSLNYLFESNMEYMKDPELVKALAFDGPAYIKHLTMKRQMEAQKGPSASKFDLGKNKKKNK